MKQWFLNLEKQQQWAVLLGGIAVSLILLVLLVWQPLAESSRQLRQSNQQAARSLHWMQQAAIEIKQLRESAAGGRKAGTAQNLSAVINNTVKSRSLPMSRFRPNGQDEAQVWLDGVVFKDLMAWLYELESAKGLAVDNLSVNSTDASGVVNARVKVRQNFSNSN
jgi:general secretion pathway protein M